MTNKELIERFDEEITIETEKGNKVPISFQMMQSIYNEITGKSEELGKLIRSRYKADFNDLNQLDKKIEQFLEQYNIVSRNESITIFYSGDNKEVFSSFERFKCYDASKTTPVAYIQLEYNFLIKLPKTEKPQSFKLELNLGSPATHMLKWYDDEVLDIINERDIAIAEVKINYVDFVVAQTLMTVIEKWIDSLKKAELEFPYSSLSQNKNFVSKIPTIVICTATTYIIKSIYHSLDLIYGTTISPTILYKILMIAIFSIAFPVTASVITQKYTRKFLSKILNISYFRLNIGDDNCIQKLQKINKKNTINGIITFSVAIITGIVSSIIVYFLTLPPSS